MVNKKNHVRIIAGQFRGRKISFPDIETLRPTSDRVRETLFNWLQHSVLDAVCLDCFAGSGSLGFEALSRGAQHVTFIDQSSDVIKSLNDNCTKFEVTATVDCFQQNVLQYLQQPAPQQFDLVFLDPPYQKRFLIQALELLQQQHWIHPKTWVYVEDNQTITIDQQHWKITHKSKAGNVHYALLMTSV